MPVTKEPKRGTPAKFEWNVPDVGTIMVDDDLMTLDLKFNNIDLHANFTNRTPWDVNKPDTEGPEGLAGWLPGFVLPCHYYI